MVCGAQELGLYLSDTHGKRKIVLFLNSLSDQRRCWVWHWPFEQGAYSTTVSLFLKMWCIFL